MRVLIQLYLVKNYFDNFNKLVPELPSCKPPGLALIKRFFSFAWRPDWWHHRHSQPGERAQEPVSVWRESWVCVEHRWGGTHTCAFPEPLHKDLSRSSLHRLHRPSSARDAEENICSNSNRVRSPYKFFLLRFETVNEWYLSRELSRTWRCSFFPPHFTAILQNSLTVFSKQDREQQWDATPEIVMNIQKCSSGWFRRYLFNKVRNRRNLILYHSLLAALCL